MDLELVEGGDDAGFEVVAVDVAELGVQLFLPAAELDAPGVDLLGEEVDGPGAGSAGEPGADEAADDASEDAGAGGDGGELPHAHAGQGRALARLRGMDETTRIRLNALMRLLITSGDITPMGVRQVEKVLDEEGVV